MKIQKYFYFLSCFCKSSKDEDNLLIKLARNRACSPVSGVRDKIGHINVVASNIQ